ncbi:hypothetical protein WR25_12061 [Diploscapter pachys]|uniref:Uncharacterized protein n=1 Tax=Diploscapter pachys TaxID=2018661 RepID=A0A2A2KC91_9BILA|nr:hypothetical protein WR25_12061 [Diploscapter pachys]
MQRNCTAPTLNDLPCGRSNALAYRVNAATSSELATRKVFDQQGERGTDTDGSEAGAPAQQRRLAHAAPLHGQIKRGGRGQGDGEGQHGGSVERHGWKWPVSGLPFRTVILGARTRTFSGMARFIASSSTKRCMARSAGRQTKGKPSASARRSWPRPANG